MSLTEDTARQLHSSGSAEGDRRDRRRFFLILCLSFLLILILNLLTPMLSDDYAYGLEVRSAGSLSELLLQEYHQYMTWSGRSVTHFILRVFLCLPMPVFKFANSLAFVAVSVLMTGFIPSERRYNWFALLLTQLALWLFAVDLSQTVLWEDGACNYLWGALIILLFMTLEKNVCRRVLSDEGAAPAAVAEREAAEPDASAGAGKSLQGKGLSSAAWAAGLFLLGLLAGWCNENTSGGCLLFVLALLIGLLRRGKGLWLPVLTGAAGNALGLMLMILSPGERMRASYATDETYSGLLGYLSRFQKLTLYAEEYFGVLLAVLLVCLVVMYLQGNHSGLRQILLFTFMSAATTYALILARPTQPRALFGAGLFLDIAVITAICSIVSFEKEHPETATGIIVRSVVYGGCAVLALQFVFEYADNGTNTARIWRDENTRISYIEEQAAEGAEEIIVPLVHTDFYNEYSAIEDMEMTEDPGFWINIMYEEYYGVASISAVDYDEWEELTGGGDKIR